MAVNKIPSSLNLEIQPDFKCPKCNCLHFRQVTRFKIISGLLVGSPHAQLHPSPAFACVNCDYEFGVTDPDIQLQEHRKSSPPLTLSLGGES